MSDDTSHLAWFYFQFDVPSQWEVIKYRKTTDKGEVILSDRHGVTMQIYWLKVKEKPHVDRRLLELAKTNLTENDLEADEQKIRSSLQEVHGWTVYRPTSRKVPVFAGLYLEDEKVLLNVTLPTHRQHDPRPRIDSLFSSYRANNGEERHWALGGIDARIPETYKLDQIELLPGAQKLFFEHRKGYRIVLYRYGMMSHHLRNQTLIDFFARITARKNELFFKDNIQKDGVYPGVELKYYTRGNGNSLTNLIARRWVGQIFLWKSPKHERIYGIEHHARSGQEIDDLIDRLQTV